MPQFSHIYDGKNTSVTLPSSDRLSAAQEGMNSVIREADQIKFRAFKDTEKWFMDATNVDVESYLSSANSKAQQDLLNKYNGEASKMLKSVNGDFTKLSSEQKMALQRGRTALEAEQKRMKSDMERYLFEKKLVESNPTDYDVEEWNKTTATEYMKYGKLPEVPIPYRRAPISAWLNTNKVRGATPPPSIVKPVAGNPDKEVAYEVSASVEDVAPVIWGKTLSDPRIMRDAQESFNELSEEEKASYLNGTNLAPYWNSSNLKNMTNPVLRNYVDKNWESGVQMTAGAPTFRKRSTGTGGGLNLEVLSAFGKTTKYAPTESKSYKLGQTTYPTYHTFNNIPDWQIPAGKEVRILNPEGEEIVSPETTLTVDVTGYDEAKRELTFVAKKDFMDKYSYTPKGANYDLAVSIDQLPPEYGELKIVKDGKIVKLKDLQQTKAAPKSDKPTFPAWKQANPNGTIDQYLAL